MNTKEKQELLGRYIQMPKEELSEMLTINENEYENSVYQLLLEAAKSRDFGTEKREIIDKASSLQQKAKEKIASESLTYNQRSLFTLFPGMGIWYHLFLPKEYRQKHRELDLCQLKGLRNYLFLLLVVIVLLLLCGHTTLNFIIICVCLILGIISISAYLHFQNKKQNKKPTTKQFSRR